MPFPKEVANSVLVKCGRRCCICRRFKPTRLQVHHIVEEAEGGSNDEANAIPLCVTCHIDVHTKAPFAQRFSPEELRRHRSRVYEMVSEGLLIEDENSQSTYSLFFNDERHPASGFKFSPMAQLLLVEAVRHESCILLARHMGGARLQAGEYGEEVGSGRRFAEAKDAIEQLENSDLIRDQGYKGEIWSVSLAGYQFADALMASAVEESRL